MINELLSLLHISEVKAFRKAEKLTIKLSKCGSAVTFNSTCIKEGLYPNYCDFRTKKNNARRSDSAAKFRRDYMRKELDDKINHKSELKRLLDESILDFLRCCR